jgi:hypothetical protein
MKPLLALAITLGFWAPIGHALSINRSGLAPQPRSEVMLRALQELYPELSLQVIAAPEAVLIDELDALHESLTGTAVIPNGALIHLACPRPACGGHGGDLGDVL